MPLMPKRTKFRKMQKGRMRGKATRGTKVTDGEYGIQAVTAGLITGNQIEAARIAMTRYIKRGGKVWIKIFPDKPITAKPGLVIGKGGQIAETLKNDLQKMIGKDVNLNIVEVKNIDLDAQLVAENICAQLERRISFRRAMKQAMQKTMKAGALGIKTSVSGRLGGADMARTEFYKEGTIPLQTLRADIDYGFYEANTTYGKIGVKVWIYKGEVLPAKKEKVEGGDQ